MAPMRREGTCWHPTCIIMGSMMNGTLSDWKTESMSSTVPIAMGERTVSLNTYEGRK